MTGYWDDNAGLPHNANQVTVVKGLQIQAKGSRQFFMHGMSNRGWWLVPLIDGNTHRVLPEGPFGFYRYDQFRADCLIERCTGPGKCPDDCTRLPSIALEIVHHHGLDDDAGMAKREYAAKNGIDIYELDGSKPPFEGRGVLTPLKAYIAPSNMKRYRQLNRRVSDLYDNLRRLSTTSPRECTLATKRGMGGAIELRVGGRTVNPQEFMALASYIHLYAYAITPLLYGKGTSRSEYIRHRADRLRERMQRWIWYPDSMQAREQSIPASAFFDSPPPVNLMNPQMVGVCE